MPTNQFQAIENNRDKTNKIKKYPKSDQNFMLNELVNQLKYIQSIPGTCL